MKIELIEHEKPKLPVCKMKCDGGLAEHLNNFELTKFMNNHSVNCLIGRPKSGKTSLLYSWFKSGGKNKIFKRVFDHIYLFQPKASRASMRDNIFEDLDEEKKFDELTYSNLETVLSRIKESEPEENHCILMDDMGAYLKDNETRKLFKEIIYNRRHLHISIFFCVQSWLSIEKDLRKLFSNTIIFKCSKSEMENLFNEIVETKKEHMLDIMKFCYDKPHQWLFINQDTSRMFKMYDEIIIPDE
jgi:hypothetical protein